MSATVLGHATATPCDFKLSRMVADLVEEMTTLRPATGLFFKSMDEEDLGETGRSWKSGMSVRAMGFTILGH